MSLLISKIERWAERHGMHTSKDWRIRCLGCDGTKNLAETGMRRIAKFDEKHAVKHTKTYCEICRRTRDAVIEPTPEAVRAESESG